MAAARQRLKDLGWEWGYGIHVNGHMMWDGYEDAFLGGVPTECDLMVTGDMGVFNEPATCRRRASSAASSRCCSRCAGR